LVISEVVQAEIMRRLQRAQAEHDVHILLAIESGSRAWGFASPNSDYDVRFIYCRRADWYLAIDTEEKRDVIEYPIVDDIDLNGWDLRKALRLLWNSNPAIVEWLQSPITYIEHGQFRGTTLELLPRIYTLAKGVHHYRSAAKSNFRGCLQADTVRLKKYFYVLRPLLAVRWIEAHGAPAPMEFEKLLATIAGEEPLLSDIRALLEKKKSSEELDSAPPVKNLNAFIESELQRLETMPPSITPRSESIDALNALFRRVLADTWRERAQ
jgi:predicted nucleotidyltransferase